MVPECTLKVYIPCLQKKSTLLPVMVYIHGGALTTEGASSYIPAYLMDRSVIVVVIQYRLGILGKLEATLRSDCVYAPNSNLVLCRIFEYRR